ncbi:sensor histidine kinase [Altererythrobacter soli]|uniref:Sensor histidine kinase n=1 Tax=Croceibacterium soli TaxID=1739690 RepID=A0A6I4UMI7_9SPHN|nr:sensor histidine kinase [Croceibacterium soli]
MRGYAGKVNSERQEPSSARVPFATVLASIGGLWLCYFLLVTIRSLLLDLGFEDEMLWRRAVVCAASAVIMLGLWLVLRLFDTRPLWAKISAALLLSLPISVLLAQANQLVFADLELRAWKEMAEQQGLRVRIEESGDLLVEAPVPNLTREDGGPVMVPIDRKSEDARFWESIAELAFGRYFMSLAWCALYLALLTGEKARAAERREGEFRRAAKAAELRSLRYQVNPHFLFNTLNSLSALVLTGKTAAAERMIQMLSTFYRRSLANDPTADVPLREEFALQKLYLDIETVRFPERLQAEYDLPDSLANAQIPGMILQPLVENSVRHAVAPASRKVTITLSAREEYGRLVVTVADDGAGGRREADHQPGFGIGLNNVHERLAARFGDEANVVSGPTAHGYATHIRIPLVGQARNAA